MDNQKIFTLLSIFFLFLKFSHDSLKYRLLFTSDTLSTDRIKLLEIDKIGTLTFLFKKKMIEQFQKADFEAKIL